MTRMMIRDEEPQDDNPRGGSYYLLTGAVLGVIIGLVLSLAFFPLRWNDSTPNTMDEDSKQDYVIAIALAYYAEKDLGRAQARLDTLEIGMNVPNYLNGLGASIRTEDGGPSLRMFAVQKLAHDLSDGVISIEGLEEFLEEEDAAPAESPTAEPESAVPTDVQEQAAVPTSTPESADTTAEEDTTEEVAEAETPDPTPVAEVADETPVTNQPFQLAERLNFCDQNLSRQLQVQVMDADGVPVQGVSIYIQWDGGSENFYTGLYPEIDEGYADYDMTDEVSYQVQVGTASIFVENLQTQTCELDDGTTYQGGIWLLFEPQS